MQPHDRPIRAEGVEVHSVEDGCVVWVPATDQVHFLNDTAMQILEMCDGEMDVAAMQAEVGGVEEVGFDLSTGILDQFEKAGILVAAPAANEIA